MANRLKSCRIWQLRWGISLAALLSPAVCVAQTTTQQPVGIGGSAMPGRSYPSPTYLEGFAFLNNGDYKNAADQFRRELASSYHIGQAHWIDSICGYTMLGEAEYRMGHYEAALEAFNAALQLYAQFPNWMLNVQFPPDGSITSAGNSRGGAPWGHTARGTRPVHLPNTMPVIIGMNGQQVMTMLQNGRGGTIIPQQGVSLQVSEIVRCTCWAIERRREILGPLGPLDPVMDDVLKAANGRGGRVNHWSECWIDVQQGVAYAAAGKIAQAKVILQRSLTMNQGQFDHPLTGLALLVLGKLSIEEADYKSAAGFFEEATYTAVDYDDLMVLNEAFQGLLNAHLMAGDSAVLDKPLEIAVQWAHKQSRDAGRELNASLDILAAENLALRGQTTPAMALLTDAKSAVTKHLMAACEVGARLNWILALAQYQRGPSGIADGDTAINNALTWEREGSKWLYLIRLTDDLCTSNANGKFSLSVANDLYARLLRDPTPADWGLDSLESLGVVSVPHPQAYEHWFDKIVEESSSLDGALEQAFEVADLTRRHRFLSSLPMGGRLLSLRWILEAPEDAIDKDGRLQRQELLTKYPNYAEVSAKARQLTADISQAGLNFDVRDAATRAAESKLTELANLSATQEAMLHEMAVGRAGASTIFPPIRKTKPLQQSLPTTSLLLTYFNTGRAGYGWLLSSDRSLMWKLDANATFEKRLTAFLRAIGNFDAYRELQATQLTDESWKQSAIELTASLLKNPKAVFRADYKELIVVPDGATWYVPFEALPIGDPKDNRPLITRLRVRYVPTTGLVMPMFQGRKAVSDYALVLDKQSSGVSPEFAQSAADEVTRAAGKVVAVRNPLPIASPMLGAFVDGVVTLDDIPQAQAPYEWSPVPQDKGKTGAGSFANWMSLPWKSSDVFILPGFHTPAENGVKSAGANSNNPPGNDLFLNTTAILSTGARTALISRWRTGGQSSVDLVREFISELPAMAADEAWQRAVELVSQAPLDGSHEPRVKRKSDANSINADHPFFWAGYMLVDTGAASNTGDQPEKKPLLKIDMKVLPDKKPDAKAPPPIPAPAAKPAQTPPAASLPELKDRPDEIKPDNAGVPPKSDGT